MPTSPRHLLEMLSYIVRADVGIGPYETAKSFIHIHGDVVRAVFLKFS